MRGTLFFGLALGFGAILVAWCARSPPGPAAPPPAAARTDAVATSDLAVLRRRTLAVPVAGVAVGDLRDSFDEPRRGHLHRAIDIMAARGTSVIAADAGTVVRLATSPAGGRTIYQLDPTESYCYYYAHLDGYARGLREGRSVRRGETIGYVGSTGNARRDAPHLHFAVSRLGPQRQCGGGTPINPYRIWVGSE
jgi:murein DD-endopeptidase MepM/ murein hydrolase activator NlpD